MHASLAPLGPREAAAPHLPALRAAVVARAKGGSSASSLPQPPEQSWDSQRSSQQQPQSPKRGGQQPIHTQRQQPQQQQQKDYHAIASGWHVRRTALHHYPLEAQERMRGERRSGASPGSSSDGGKQRQGPTVRQHEPPGSPGVPPEVTAPMAQLLAVLRWEAASGYGNGHGSNGERFSEWTAGRLLTLASQLGVQEQQLGAQGGLGLGARADSSSSRGGNDVEPSGTATAGLAAACADLAQEFEGYASLDAAGKAVLTQRARLTAEELLQHAVTFYKSEQQGRQQQQPYEGRQLGSQHGAARQERQAGATAGRQTIVPAAETPQQRKQQRFTPQLLSRQALIRDLALGTDPDAAAALAHEEETMNGGPSVGTAVASPNNTANGGGSSSGILEQVPLIGEDGGLLPSELFADEAGGEGGAAGTARRRRVVGPATQGFRKSFAAAAAAFTDAAGKAKVSSMAEGEQRTPQWHRLRERRLTASAFSKALGFFTGDREGLWEEKVGLRAPFAGNAATSWGTKSEALALGDYELNTGQSIQGCMFQVKHDDMAHGWLGASPDGLIGGLTISNGEPADPATGHIDGAEGGASESGGMAVQQGVRGAGVMAGEGPGVLEVKCPYNKGAPEQAVPPEHAIWYYMPQVQGLMDIFDREWCNLFVWTPAGGSGLYHIRRDRDYWAACFGVLSEFWWNHVVPARQARERYGLGAPELDRFRPPKEPAATTRLKDWSKQMAVAAPATFFPPRQPRQQQ
ncbi:hypothetical protein N2152v2_003244 [Parachlorella kessleri]